MKRLVYAWFKRAQENKVRQLEDKLNKVVLELGGQSGRLGKWYVHRVRMWARYFGTPYEQERYKKLMNTSKAVAIGGIRGADKFMAKFKTIIKWIDKSINIIKELKNNNTILLPGQIFELNSLLQEDVNVPHVGGDMMEDIYQETLENPPIPNIIENMKKHIANWMLFLNIDANSTDLLSLTQVDSYEYIIEMIKENNKNFLQIS